MEKGPQMTYYELLKALVSGKKVRSKCWQEHEYIKFDDGNLVDEKGERFGYINFGTEPKWEIYYPPLTPKELQIIEYCRPELEHMWASTIIGIILDCDFRDADSELRKRGLK